MKLFRLHPSNDLVYEDNLNKHPCHCGNGKLKIVGGEATEGKEEVRLLECDKCHYRYTAIEGTPILEEPGDFDVKEHLEFHHLMDEGDYRGE